MLSAADLPAVRGETMVLKVHKQDKDVKVGSTSATQRTTNGW